MIDWKTIVFFILTLSLMGFFAGIEMAFYSANRLSIEIKKKKGSVSTQILSRFYQYPARFLGTTLVGYTIFLVFLGLQFSKVMHPIWFFLHIQPELLHSLLEIALTTLIVLVFAEFIPRAWFRAKSNKLLNRLALVIDFFYQMFQPLASGFIDLSEWVLKYVFNIRFDKTKEPFLRSDLKHLFQPREDEERLERNTLLMEHAQELPKIKIRQCLVPRKDLLKRNSVNW
jgi:putative hemolysin